MGTGTGAILSEAAVVGQHPDAGAYDSGAAVE
jgi:hypothetical protein